MEKLADKDGDIIRSTKDSEKQGVLNFIWNADTKEFCGRNGISWLRITIFYIVFYVLLAGFWTVMLLIFYQTLDYYTPRWTLDSSRIGNNPGLGFRPRPHPDNVDSTLIWFTHGMKGKNNETMEWEYWVNSLNRYLKDYKEGGRSGEFVRRCDFEHPYNESHVCEFDVDKLGNNCTYSNFYGYDVGHPCVILKLNRIYNWVPEPYKELPATMPNHIRENYDPRYVYISCQGENPADRENIGPVLYYPPNGGIPKYYFPFTNLDGYLSPFVFVHFTKPASGVVINIECKAWAANIKHDRNDRLGSVHFELLID